jgi:signal transduction histidine kinase
MASDGVVCLEDPTGDELQWPERVPQAVGLFVIAMAVIVAIQRGEFTSPNWGLAIIVLMTTPWLLDMIGRPRSLFRELRLQYPLLVLWSLTVLVGVFWLTSAYPLSDDFSYFFLTILVGEMAGTVGARFGAAVWGIGIAGLIVVTNVEHFHGLVIWSFALTIGLMGGLAFRRQVQVTTELSNAQTQLAQQAAEEERHRLARDVHDLIAHSLAVTMLQLSGARLALAAGDTDEALSALADAETAGRAAMSEIHRTVGLLGPGQNQGGAPTPNATDLPDLVAGFRRAGLVVDYDLYGDLEGVPLASGLAAYRLVQESLSNAVKHAPGAPVRLSVHVSDHEIRVDVVNPVVTGTPRSDGGGNGLRGMKERAELLGGSVDTSNGDGNWTVAACIPWAESTL